MLLFHILVCGLVSALGNTMLILRTVEPVMVDCAVPCGAELGSQAVMLLMTFPQLSTAGPWKPTALLARLSRGSGTEGASWSLEASQPEKETSKFTIG